MCAVMRVMHDTSSSTKHHRRRTKTTNAVQQQHQHAPRTNNSTHAPTSSAGTTTTRRDGPNSSPSRQGRLWPASGPCRVVAAAELNQRGVQTARGGQWTARSVLNLKARVA
jgi:hypothetical protein